jgi:hypothetical protein
MARVLALEEVSHGLRSQLCAHLRVCDEVTVLPSASRSMDSGAFKNVVFRLSGSEGELDPELFGADLFSGLSIVEVPTHLGDKISSQSADERTKMLGALRKAIPSELADSELQVGPLLDGDEVDRDTAPWFAGFDGPSASVGLYAAHQARAPEGGTDGMQRSFKTYFLVCRAGGGVAAETFHARLTASLRAGKSLDAALESGTQPGPQALRRVATAARRNRSRILALAARAIGIDLDSISDTASHPGDGARGAIVSADVVVNSLRKDVTAARSTWLYAPGAADAAVSSGLATSSCVSEGYVVFFTGNHDLRVKFRNASTHDTISFATPRLAKTRDAAMTAAAAHKAASTSGRGARAHPDAAFVARNFTWKSKAINVAVDIEPACLWGSHAPEAFLASWGRELGLAAYKMARLEPELVCIASLEAAKLRAAIRHVLG